MKKLLRTYKTIKSSALALRNMEIYARNYLTIALINLKGK
jgi:hypothetical protein